MNQRSQHAAHSQLLSAIYWTDSLCSCMCFCPSRSFICSQLSLQQVSYPYLVSIHIILLFLEFHLTVGCGRCCGSIKGYTGKGSSFQKWLCNVRCFFAWLFAQWLISSGGLQSRSFWLFIVPISLGMASLTLLSTIGRHLLVTLSAFWEVVLVRVAVWAIVLQTTMLFL